MAAFGYYPKSGIFIMVPFRCCEQQLPTSPITDLAGFSCILWSAVRQGMVPGSAQAGCMERLSKARQDVRQGSSCPIWLQGSRVASATNFSSALYSGSMPEPCTPLCHFTHQTKMLSVVSDWWVIQFCPGFYPCNYSFPPPGLPLPPMAHARTVLLFKTNGLKIHALYEN